MHPDVEQLEAGIGRLIGGLKAELEVLHQEVMVLKEQTSEAAIRSSVQWALQEVRADARRLFFQWIGERAVASVALVIGTAVLTWALLTGRIVK